MTDSIYTSGRLINTDNLGPFNRSIAVYGIKIGGMNSIGGNDAVQDEFIRKVAETIKMLLNPNAQFIDLSSQRKAISKLKEVNTLQRIGVEEYNSYNPTLDSGQYKGWDLTNDTHSVTDFIWQFNLPGDSIRTTNSQVTEVLEHLLHTLVRFALPGAFPEHFLLIDAWGVDDGRTFEANNELSGLLYEAAKEAINNGVFDSSSYQSFGEGSFEYWQVVMTEYQYALTFAEWGLIEIFAENGSMDPELSLIHI